MLETQRYKKDLYRIRLGVRPEIYQLKIKSCKIGVNVLPIVYTIIIAMFKVNALKLGNYVL